MLDDLLNGYLGDYMRWDGGGFKDPNLEVKKFA